MDPHHQKLIEITVQFLQFITSIFVILLTATGAAFFYYYTNKLKGKNIGALWPLAIPSTIMLGAFVFIWVVYKRLIDGLAEGIIIRYMEFWYKYTELTLGLLLIGTILFLVVSFVWVHKKIAKLTP
jgi:hypothetical protein